MWVLKEKSGDGYFVEIYVHEDSSFEEKTGSLLAAQSFESEKDAFAVKIVYLSEPEDWEVIELREDEV